MLENRREELRGKAESACWPANEGIYMTYCRAGVCCDMAAMVTRHCTRRSCEGDELTAHKKKVKKPPGLLLQTF